MKEFTCDRCKKSFDEDVLFGEDYEISEILNGFEHWSFSFGEIIYDGGFGDLCKSCINKLFVEELKELLEKIQGVKGE